MQLPGALLNWAELRFLDASGDPLSSGTLTFYIVGTSTPKDTYSDTTLLTANSNPVTLGAGGRPSSPIFLGTGGYKLVVKNSAGVEQYTVDGIEDTAGTAFAILGNTLATGDTAATSGDTIAVTSNLIVVTSAAGDDPATINLPAASAYGSILSIINKTGVTLKINVDGTDTISGATTSYTIAAGVSPNFPQAVLLSDGTSVWWVISGTAV
jgi:hypothetical protein